MAGTPQLRSAFPQTPQKQKENGTSREHKPQVVNRSKPSVGCPRESAAPLIPVEIVEAPSQRLYVLAFYVALNTCRLYDSWVTSDDLDTTWLFLKWGFIDIVFLFGLQALRIPWLDWSFSTSFMVLLLHITANLFLMFRIPLPVGTWIGGLIKIVYDRELSISERKVKPGDIIHNSSLILGKQIVHILPEGSAKLNADRTPFCLDSDKTSVSLPIQINQTNPIFIELLRFDLDTGQNETIKISSKQLKQLKRQAAKLHPNQKTAAHSHIFFPVRETGIYRLLRVLDESKLEVQTRLSDTLVVSCPKAVLRNSHSHKCKGELSDLVLEVEGTPPLKVKYSRKLNELDSGFSFQNIQAETPSLSLLTKHSDLLISPNKPNATWARMQTVRVPLNESLNTGGDWLYAIEEVHDAYGNIVNYTSYLDETDRPLTKVLPQWYQLSVHERPLLSLTGCNVQKFLEVAKEDSIELPLQFHATGQAYGSDGPFKVTYSYSGTGFGVDGPVPTKVRHASLKTMHYRPRIKEPGWYVLNDVSSQFCSGEILEPSSCFLHNPPEPELTLRYENIFDKCANNSVGLLVELDLIGSPPFRLLYSIEHSKGIETYVHIIETLRGQLEFTPPEAGFYRYRFLNIGDSVYEARSLKDKIPILEQDVKPPASALVLGSRDSRIACFGESVPVDISFIGEPPWTMEYELVHNGKKAKHTLTADNIVVTISTKRLLSGGEYILSLTSIKDRSNCTRLLKESIKIEVRPKMPGVSFGHIERKRSVFALEDSNIQLPLRLSGEAPWTIKYRNLAINPSLVVQGMVWEENGVMNVNQPGRYQLVDVSDATCPGAVDESAKEFEVSWIARPKITSLDGIATGTRKTFTKREMCEGDRDILELQLSGNPPFSIQYEHQWKGASGPPLLRVQRLQSPLTVVSMDMDTSRPGENTYKFMELADSLYDHDPKKHTPVIVTQRVSSLPSAHFDSPGRIYGFCKEDINEDELIPVTLEGVPPFSLEIAIRHHSTSKPETVAVANISVNKLNLPIPRRYLSLGQHVVSIQKVRDARGCHRMMEHDASSVRISVSDVPTIIPLESRSDYCVGERIAFSLSGQAPFEIFYTFGGFHRKATSQSSTFRRIAEKPGEFTITAISDGASGRCKAHKNLTKTIHELPSARISKGRESVIDIHEGGEAEINLEFWGTPPFEYTYTRSSNARKGKKSEILDVRHDISHEHTKDIKASDEGTYEVVAIKDKFCSFSSQKQLSKPGKAAKAPPS